MLAKIDDKFTENLFDFSICLWYYIPIHQKIEYELLDFGKIYEKEKVYRL
jgi:hypothetical protein